MIKRAPPPARSAVLEHHGDAARRHQLAATHHHEAARHFQIGKDYDHAAHRASLAHGHALLAIDMGSKAVDYYRRHHDDLAKVGAGPITRASVEAVEAAGALRSGLGVSAHHDRAAFHHERAASLHLQAMESCDASDFALALSDTGSACTEAQCALFHGDEAAKRHAAAPARPPGESSETV
ncbi:hypothetical protein [Zavarzinia sp.]|uniref:hypothetical protein n=1 Tax=Zavarzinia sp. TaxID=2027920 RepID=UPI0035627434